jgi:hypothetical protein
LVFRLLATVVSVNCRLLLVWVWFGSLGRSPAKIRRVK